MSVPEKHDCRRKYQSNSEKIEVFSRHHEYSLMVKAKENLSLEIVLIFSKQSALIIGR